MNGLEESLQQYKLMHTPTQFSVYQFWANQTFSHDNLFDCTPEEQKKFEERITESTLTFCDNIKAKEGKMGTLKSLIDMLRDPKRQNVPKIERNVLYTSTDGLRPIGVKAFDQWGGLQIIDMDIKDRRFAETLKDGIFKRLIKYNWFLGVAFSSSGKGLHVYTKIRVSEGEQDDPQKKKLLYLTNFRHKYSFVYLACTKIIPSMKNDDGTPVTTDQLMKWMDFAMFKPQQGAFVGYDPAPLINTHFFEDFIYVNFDNVEDMGHPDVDWVTYPDLREAFKRWEWFEEDDKPATIEVKEAPLLAIDTHTKVHYKHFERWRLANTLVSLYGVEQGFKYLRMICSGEIPTKEIQADCITAGRHQKPIDPWAINTLNKKHGFNIKVNIDQEEKDLTALYNKIDDITNPTLIRESPHTITFHIRKDEYLGDIKYDILRNTGMITLIDAGAGVGKTEMVKSLVNVDSKRVLLVMPFTSTIKSKVEGDAKWDYSYGNKKILLESKPGIALTIDKFSRLNMMDVKESGFDYIFIDESHLMFQSEYRPVMAKVIEMIRNTEIPIILMSGTPVGETVFFDDIVHIKVIKEDVRKKEFKVFLTERPIDNLCHMCEKMAEDVANERRVLFPTNKGSIFKAQIEALVGYFLKNKYHREEPPIVNYYKKSNVGEEFMDDVNIRKTVAKTEILLCSTYLSVGVDILDQFEFNIYFNNLWMPQEIEQFANRLRSHDLYIRLFINRKNAVGDSLDVIDYKPCNFNLDQDQLKDMKSIVRSCNAMIERNPVEYRYNSLVASIIQNNKFIEYNEVENKYYVNEIAYKTIMFERKYREYVQQLPVLAKGMMSYGYEYSSVDLGEYKGMISEDFFVGNDINELLNSVKSSEQSKSTRMVDELMDRITEERLNIYVEVMKGLYDIKKGDEWSEDPVAKKMVVKNMEVFEKVVPIFTSMSRMFDIDDIKDIFAHCINNNGTYSFSAIHRVKLFANMWYNAKLKRLDLPIKQFMDDSYKFVEDYGLSNDGNIPVPVFQQFIHDRVLQYARNDSTEEIVIEYSPLTMQSYTETLTELFKCLINVSRPRGPRNARFLHMEPYEMIWEDKHEKYTSFNKQVEWLSGFLDRMEVSESRISADEVVPVDEVAIQNSTT